ncbi:hypothetical protein BRC67_12435, partial [Halobacteriales archaeon QH_3_68_24]
MPEKSASLGQPDIAVRLQVLDDAGGVAADPTALSELAVNVTPEGVSGPHALDALDRALVGLDREYDYVVVDRDGEFVIRTRP